MPEKTEVLIPEDSEQSLPFFARFLEAQAPPEVSKMTLKYPSDRDEIDRPLEYSSGDSVSVPHK